MLLEATLEQYALVATIGRSYVADTIPVAIYRVLSFFVVINL
jgi:hypothetical protein